MAAERKHSFLLGSGLLYVMEYSGTIPTDIGDIETEENRFGLVSGGAALEYKPTFYGVNDDLGYVKEQILTAEEVTLKSGLLFPNAKFIEKAAPTASITEDTAAGTRTTEIGGLSNISGKSYLIRFVHKSAVDPSKGFRVTIVGTNQSGFSLSFAKDKESITDMEWSAKPLNDEGRLIRIEESIPVATPAP